MLELKSNHNNIIITLTLNPCVRGAIVHNLGPNTHHTALEEWPLYPAAVGLPSRPGMRLLKRSRCPSRPLACTYRPPFCI